MAGRGKSWDERLVERLLERLNAADYRPETTRQLFQRLDLPSERRPAARRVLKRLVREGRVARYKGNRWRLPRPGTRRRATGERAAATVLGRLEVRDGRATLQPFDRSESRRIGVPPRFRDGAVHGDAVEVRVTGGRRGEHEGRVVENLGALEESGVDTEIVIRRFGLRSRFPGAARDEAAQLPPAVPADEAARRQRFDDPPVVTIDGETAQDFDDAISVRSRKGGGFRLWVHIADVSAFVRPGGALDREARARGTSVYFPGRVLPMLPEKLSNDLCSLRPGEDRLVQSAILDFDRLGRLRRCRFADGVIRSAARLTYRQVAAALEGGKPRPAIKPKVLEMLAVADRLREVLETKRHRRGSIDFDLPEPQILLDVEGEVTGVKIEPRNRAHRMIEEFMLAANEAVAGWLAERDRPCFYRIHERPDPEKLIGLADFAKGLGFPVGGDPSRWSSKRIMALLEEAEGRPEYPVIAMVALRSMKQARYTPENAGHFGLAAPVYCHFTSPIRRYPDLIVHRLLRAARGGREGELTRLGRGLDKLGEQNSTSERNAEAAERQLLEWKKIRFLTGREGDTFSGVVTGVASFGLFVQLTEAMVEGLVRVEDLGPEWFEWREARHELVGSSTGATYRLGMALEVRLTRVDPVLRRIDLVPVRSREPQRVRRPKRVARRRRRR